MRKKQKRRVVWPLALLGLIAAGTILLAPKKAESQAAPSEPTWSIALTGDSIAVRPFSMYDDPAFMSIVKVIRDADAASTNLELQLFRLREFYGYPQVENGGNWELGAPEVAPSLKWMGVDLLARANNHTTDYGVEGFIVTDQLLDSLSLVHAGTGMTAGEAAQAKYYDSKAGRFAFISLATSFTPMSRAGEPRSEIKGRPGLNALRVDMSYQLAPAQLAEWRKIVKSMGGEVPESEKASVRFGGVSFAPGAENKVIAKVNARDEERILGTIRSASRQASFVIVNAHSHWTGSDIMAPPPDYIKEFAKKCLDAGADVYAIHGPHKLRGVEIYKDKPILYSLGNFIFHNQTIEPMPDDMYENYGVMGVNKLAADLFDSRSKVDPKTGQATAGHEANYEEYESVVAVPNFKGHKLVEMKLYPVDMGMVLPRPIEGTPRLADGEMAKKIIDRLIKMSEQYKTKIVFKDGIGVWEPSAK